ncbi:24-hydroxycholesterol 7-alpha-hydroxylase isoform 2-T2 [Discoglossus pictus]
MMEVLSWLPGSSAALGLLVAVLAGMLVRYILHRSSHSPPCIRGWIPWFGAAFQMGREPLEFIRMAREKYGPVFTVLAAGNRLTFVSGEEGISTFFTSKQVNFPQAVQKPVQNTASIGEKNFYQSHDDIHEMIKLRLSQNRLYLQMPSLLDGFYTHLEELGPAGSKDLYDLVRQIMYPAVVDTLFGKGMCPTGKDTLQEFEGHFRMFDEGFEYGSQLPEFFLKDWSKSKQWLLKLFKHIVVEAEQKQPTEESSKTLLQHLLDVLKGNSTYNNSMLLLWASQANANPVTFWALAFIISHPEVYKNVMDEITSVFGDAGKGRLHITEGELRKLPYTKSCVLEAIRLRAPGAITRKVVQPLKIYNYEIPPGDMLMLSPYWVHRDPKMFPEPETFKPVVCPHGNAHADYPDALQI